MGLITGTLLLLGCIGWAVQLGAGIGSVPGTKLAFRLIGLGFALALLLIVGCVRNLRRV